MSKDVVEKKDRELAIYNSYQQLKAIATDLHKSGLFKHLANPQKLPEADIHGPGQNREYTALN